MALKSNSVNKSEGSEENTLTVAAIGPDTQNNQGYRRSRRDSGPIRFHLSRTAETDLTVRKAIIKNHDR